MEADYKIPPEEIHRRKVSFFEDSRKLHERLFLLFSLKVPKFFEQEDGSLKAVYPPDTWEETNLKLRIKSLEEYYFGDILLKQSPN